MPSSVSAVTNPTLADLASRLDPKGRMAHVIEVLTETNEILDDMTMMRGNLPFGHKSTIRTGLPKATWRKFYQGVNPTKSTTAVVTDNCGMLEAYSEVDYDLYEQHGSQKNVFRMDEDSAHIEGMNQQIAEHLFYGDEVVVPQSFTGFFPRYNTLNENVPIARNVFSGSGTAGDNGSIFICNWSPKTIFGMYPQGSKSGGVRMENLGMQLLPSRTKGAEGLWKAMVSHYKWDIGLCVADWRAGVRICNLPRGILSSDSGAYAAGTYTGGTKIATGDNTPSNLPDLLTRSLIRVQKRKNMGMGRKAIYMDETMLHALQRQLSAQTSESTLTYTDVAGVTTTSFRGTPIRQVDTLYRNEARVV